MKLTDSLHVELSAGDPLYAVGGQPKCFDPDVVDAAPFAEDGYKLRSLYFVLSFSNTFSKLNNI